MNKVMWNINKLQEWEINKKTRFITVKDFDRLKNQIKKLGQYKPLVITKEGIVLGGNHRLKAYRELKINEVWVSVVEPKDEAEMFEYALSDNDNVAQYSEDGLANIIANYDIKLSDYSITLSRPVNLQGLVDAYKVPDNLTSEKENRPFKIIITFKDQKDLEEAKANISKILENFKDSYYSVSAGEL